jgi:carbonic anhydrase
VQRVKLPSGCCAGKLAVVGVLLQRGAASPNEALKLGLTYGPPQPSVVERYATCIDIKDLLMKTMPPPNDYGHRPYVHYQGSLTTPPCSEGVSWFVMATPGSVTDSQVNLFLFPSEGFS